MSDDSRWRRDREVGRPNVPADVDAELGFHREALIEDLVRGGLSVAAARVEADRRLGTFTVVRRELVTMDAARDRRDRRSERITGLVADVRYAFRTLRKHPLFTTMAVTSLGLGIGSTATILSAAHAILVRALPYRDADGLVAIYSGVPDKGWHGTNISYQDYLAWRAQNRTFQDIGIYTWSTLAFSGEGVPERVEAAAVAPGLFPLLGVEPALGRGFRSDEAVPNGPRVLLLGDDLWRRRFGADSAIVGKSVMVDGRASLVIGVMPPAFGFPVRGQAWTPFVPDPSDEDRGNRGYAGAIGRLKPGVTFEAGQADLAAVSARLQKDFPKDNFGWVTETLTLRDDLVGDLRRPVEIFLLSVGFVLLIVCANVANLVLARGADRRRELAVRIAIGAGRRRLVRQLVTESLVLAVAGGVVGGLLSVGGIRLFRLAFPGDVPFYIHLGVDGTALAIVAVVTLATGILFGTWPALRATSVDLAGTLRDGQRGGEGVDRGRLRRILVTVEFALSFALLVGAGLLIKSYRGLTGTDLGFEEHGILSARVSLPTATYDTPARRVTFYLQLLERLEGLPGVTSVGSAGGIPFSGWNIQGEMAIEGRPPRRQGDELTVHFQEITPGYFPTIGTPIVRGRNLTLADRDSANPVGLINETLARREFAGVDPVGQRIRTGGEDSRNRWITIVGVVRDIRHYRLPQPMGPALYLPYGGDNFPNQTVVIRTSLPDPHTLVAPLQAVLKEIDPAVPAYAIRTFDEVVAQSLWQQRLQGRTLGIFAALALVLASVGVYGVVSYSVAQRTREIGVRMALGATSGDVRSLVLRQGLAMVGVGTTAGVVLALASARLLEGALYGVTATDPTVFALVFGVLGTSAAAACYFPARRAAGVDPLIAMRAE